MNFIKELVIFGLKQARASAFAGSFLLLLAVASVVHVPGLVRADVLFLGAVAIQFVLIAAKHETVDEAKVIALFHLVGLCLELYKTHPAIGSWTYPEPGHFRVGGVPLFSGFMYAAVGSYIAQSWKVMRLKMVGMPPSWVSVSLCAAIYLNFFTNRWIYDFRWVLAALVLAVFGRTVVEFVVVKTVRRMPLPLAFVLIAFFIWLAENIVTFSGAWLYPHQVERWSAVHLIKVSSWSLLVILSFVIVAELKAYKARRAAVAVEPAASDDVDKSPIVG